MTPTGGPSSFYDVAFTHREVPARLKDIERLTGKEPREVKAAFIDILRAGTSILAALNAGSRKIVPVESPEEAKELKERLSRAAATGPVLLGGERGGRRLQGFDLGNSPLEYRESKVRGATIIMTTTNGTHTLKALSGVGLVLVAGFGNLDAGAKRLSREQGPYLLACSGREGAFCLEDALCAGMILENLLKARGEPRLLSDSARTALFLAKEYGSRVDGALRGSLWGERLWAMGFGDDLSFCARLNWTDAVPHLEGGAIIL
ncbi:MAG: 2-phosphosulfolactate phosphatase [Nitrospinota bacterium]